MPLEYIEYNPICTHYTYCMLSVNKLNLNFNLSDVKDKFEKIDSNKDGKLSTKVFIILKDS